jgi:hypothetical protein
MSKPEETGRGTAGKTYWRTFYPDQGMQQCAVKKNSERVEYASDYPALPLDGDGLCCLSTPKFPMKTINGLIDAYSRERCGSDWSSGVNVVGASYIEQGQRIAANYISRRPN